MYSRKLKGCFDDNCYSLPKRRKRTHEVLRVNETGFNDVFPIDESPEDIKFLNIEDIISQIDEDCNLGITDYVESKFFHVLYPYIKKCIKKKFKNFILNIRGLGWKNGNIVDFVVDLEDIEDEKQINDMLSWNKKRELRWKGYTYQIQYKYDDEVSFIVSGYSTEGNLKRYNRYLENAVFRHLDHKGRLKAPSFYDKPTPIGFRLQIYGLMRAHLALIAMRAGMTHQEMWGGSEGDRRAIDELKRSFRFKPIKLYWSGKGFREGERFLISDSRNDFFEPPDKKICIPLNYDGGGRGASIKLSIPLLYYYYGLGLTTREVFQIFKKRGLFFRELKSFRILMSELFDGDFGPYLITEDIIRMMRDDGVSNEEISEIFNSYLSNVRHHYHVNDFMDHYEYFLHLTREGFQKTEIQKKISLFLTPESVKKHIQVFIDEYLGEWLGTFRGQYEKMKWGDLSDFLIADKALALLCECSSDPTRLNSYIGSQFEKQVSGVRLTLIIDRVFKSSLKVLRREIYANTFKDLVVSKNYKSQLSMYNDYKFSSATLEKVLDYIILYPLRVKRLGLMKKRAAEIAVLGPLLENFYVLNYPMKNLVNLIGYFDTERALNQWVIRFFGSFEDLIKSAEYYRNHFGVRKLMF